MTFSIPTAAAVSLLALLPSTGIAQVIQRDDPQDELKLPTKQSKFELIGEIGFDGTDNNVVAAWIEQVKGFAAAGVKDGEDDHNTNRLFMTPETFAAMPLHFRFYMDAERDKSDRRYGAMPLLALDYQKEIDFRVMFANMHPKPTNGSDALLVRGVWMCPVKRPEGGYRLNFGDRVVFGDEPAKNELLTTYTAITTEAPNEKLMARLRQMPIYGMFDFRSQMRPSELREMTAAVGPKAAILAASISMMAKRPVLDVYSAMSPGDGVVGQYMDRRPGQARLLGNLPANPGLILCADLGKTVPRSLMSFARAAPDGSDIHDVLEPLMILIESWNGALTLVASGANAPAAPTQSHTEGGGERTADIDASFERLAKSLQGTAVFGIEENSGAEIVKSLEDFLTDLADKGDAPIEALKDVGGKAFKLQVPMPDRTMAPKFISFGASGRMFVISIANSLTVSHDLRNNCLTKQGATPLPKKFGMAQGPIKLWLHKGMAGYVGTWFSGIRTWIFGPSVGNRVEWIQNKLDNELLNDNLAATLSWTPRFGTMLRVLF